MATAVEKFDKIENIHDDGASTRNSDLTATTKESDSTTENGKWKRNNDGICEKKLFSKGVTKKCKWKVNQTFERAPLCDHLQQQLVLIERQLTEAFISRIRSRFWMMIKDPVGRKKNEFYAFAACVCERCDGIMHGFCMDVK